MSFGLPPFSAGWVPSFKSSIRLRRTCGLKLGPAVRVPAKPHLSRGEEGILNQNPIFEMGSNVKQTYSPSISEGVGKFFIQTLTKSGMIDQGLAAKTTSHRGGM